MGRLLSVCVGGPRPLRVGGRTVPSATARAPVRGSVRVRPLGLEGDEVADPSVHGGLAKAIYAYPAEHLPFWQTVRAQARVSLWEEPLGPTEGAALLGANLVLQGVTEERLWIGDVLLFPRCALAVSEPRRPCHKFSAAMGFAQAARLMKQSGFCGAYLAVRQDGFIEAGEAFTLLPGPREVNLRELFRQRAG